MLEADADLGLADLHVVDRIVAELVAGGLVTGDDLLLVGAQCRDIWHQALGHADPVRRTNDVDVGIAVRHDMAEFAELVAGFAPAGETGIRFEVASLMVDLVPFGEDVEHPPGTVQPPGRQFDPFSVFGFEDVHLRAVTLPLPSGLTVRLATPAGFTVLKVAAWHDRSRWHEDRDGVDLALVLSWYGRSESVIRWLWDDDPSMILPAFDYDTQAASAHLAGRLARDQLRAPRAEELADLWRESRTGLAAVMRASGWLGHDADRVGSMVAAFGAGIESA